MEWCASPFFDAAAAHSFASSPGPLPTKQYSGLIDVGPAPSGVGNALMHFWFMESEGNPKTDPVLMWYNGGPGASSIYGLVRAIWDALLNGLRSHACFRSLSWVLCG